MKIDKDQVYIVKFAGAEIPPCAVKINGAKLDNLIGQMSLGPGRRGIFELEVSKDGQMNYCFIDLNKVALFEATPESKISRPKTRLLQ